MRGNATRGLSKNRQNLNFDDTVKFFWIIRNLTGLDK